MSSLPEMSRQPFRPRPLRCRYCGYETAAWWTFHGRRRSGKLHLRHHIERVHPDKYRELYGSEPGDFYWEWESEDE
jgi:hypothetical protein